MAPPQTRPENPDKMKAATKRPSYDKDRG